VMIALLSGCAMVAAWWAVGKAGDVPLEELDRRSSIRGGVAAAAFVLDFRGVALLQRSARQAITGYRRARVPRPRAPALAMVWRGATSLRRAPARFAWAAGLVAVAVLAIDVSGGSIAQAAIGVIVAYVAATRLVEPMRFEADDTDASRRLPWTWGDLAVRHAALPSIVLTCAAWLAAALLGAAGSIPSSGLLATIAFAPLAAATLAGCAVHMAARGRLPVWLFFYGQEMVLLWFATGPLMAALAVGIPVSSAVVAFDRGTDPSAALWTPAFLQLIGLAIVLQTLRARKPPG
jgi:Family of unknown function (DUF6297)